MSAKTKLTTYEQIAQSLSPRLADDRVFLDDLQRIAWGTDASFYGKRPQMVVKTRNEDDAVAVMKACSAAGAPITFRAAGTGLSGQSITDSVLMVAGQEWSTLDISPTGQHVRLGPGVIGAAINRALAPYGYKFGPDPATINSAMVGGMIANNASGMSCGTHANSYRLIQGARIVFADGYVLDTSDIESRKAFVAAKPELVHEIMAIREEIMANPDMVDTITRKYKIKNVTGYGMNAFVDYTDPVDIILHLMVGSEGTLGFLSEATMANVPKASHAATALVFFKDLKSACETIIALKDTGAVDAAELLDYRALISVHESSFESPEMLGDVPEGSAAVLLETYAFSDGQLDDNRSRLKRVLDSFEPLYPYDFTTDAAEVAALWKVRKGVFPAVGGTRPTGTSCIIEDFAFPIDSLSAATVEFRDLCDAYGYPDAVIYGHALEGNYHVIFSEDFADPTGLERYERFIDACVALVVDRHSGSLKAEHGTGINMAPFVEREWGSAIYQLMRRVKAAFDPQNILNPGVIINDDPECHVKGFKELPAIDALVDPCIECGFCEVNCVSHSFTLSARQRIAVSRVLKLMERDRSKAAELRELRKDFQYLGVETCAADGLCKTSCPLGIDTGKYVKAIRGRTSPALGKAIARFTARRFGFVETVARTGLAALSPMRRAFGDGFLHALTSLGRGLRLPVPAWNNAMPGPARALPKSPAVVGTSGPRVLYFSACLHRIMGPAPGDSSPTVPQTVARLCEKAGITMVTGRKPDGLCCGQPWESYGHTAEADRKSSELEDWLREQSDNGELPIIVETTACLDRMKRAMSPDLRIYGPEEFAALFLLPRLEVTPVAEKVAIHATCTTKKTGLADMLVALAEACAEEVVVPQKVGCCGMAGNRGLNHPELNSHGLRHLKEEVHDCTCGYSVSATCEIGLTNHSGIPYSNILELVDRATAPKPAEIEETLIAAATKRGAAVGSRLK